jgi:hypothetical protein
MAEQSLGVGPQSDWYVIAETATTLHGDLLKLLEKLYKQERHQEEQRFIRAEKQIQADIAKRAPKQPSDPPALTSSHASNEQQQPSEQSPGALKEKG